METAVHRVAINAGGGCVPGINAVVAGAVLSANKLGCEIVGIRDGYDGLMSRGNYPDGGLVKLSPQVVENLSGGEGSILGTAARTDPFMVRTINAVNYVEELDRSDELLETIHEENIDAMISIVGGSALTGAACAERCLQVEPKGTPHNLCAQIVGERRGRDSPRLRIQHRA
jgi:ATP-dependent phosphofructokinase / diphosphate-dependent phosphofructokinase